MKPPYGAVEIDWGHPLANGLQFCTLLNEGAGGPVELVRQVVGTLAGNAVWAPSAVAPSVLALDGTGDYADFVYPHDPWGGKLLSIVSRVRLTASAASPRVVDRVYNGQFALYVNSGTGAGNLALKTAGTSLDASVTATGQINYTAPTWVSFTATYDGDTARGYINGLLSGQSTTPSGVLAASAVDITIGERTDRANPSRAWPGQIERVLLYDRCLTADEVWGHFADPYCFLPEVVRRRYVVLGGAGGQTYNEALSLAASATLSPAAQAVFDCGLGLTASASMSDGAAGAFGGALSLPGAAALASAAQLDAVAALSLSAQASLTAVAQAELAAALGLPASAALVSATTLDAQAALTLAAAAQITPAALATLLGTLALPSTAGLSAGSQLVADAALALAGQATLTPASQLDAQAALLLPASAQIQSTTGNLYQAALLLAATGALTPAAQADLAAALALPGQATLIAAESEAVLGAQLALQARADLALVSQHVATMLLSLGASASVVAQASAQMSAALTLSAAATLIAASLLNVTDPVFLRIVAQALLTPTITGESFSTPTITGESLEPEP